MRVPFGGVQVGLGSRGEEVRGMAGKGEGNGRVTLAVLSAKLDVVIAKLEELSQGQRADHDRIAMLEGELNRLRDRQSVLMVALTGLNVVVSNVVGWLWTR